MAELKELLEERRKLVDKKATLNRESRDEWNEKTKQYTETRNELNNEVRELIVQVKEQRELRDQMNEIVRQKKQERDDASKIVQSLKENTARPQHDKPVELDKRGRPIRPETPASLKRKMERMERDFNMGKFTGKNEKKFFDQMKRMSNQLKSLQDQQGAALNLEDNEELKAAMEQHEAAWAAVKEAAEAAQSAHDLMYEWNDEVDKQREKAESAHRKLRQSKKEADRAHSLYIVSLRCLHSIQDIIRAMRGASEGQGQKPTASNETQDLMAKLMSGEALSAEDILRLQRFD